jgi:hypothetical protein
MYHRGSMKRVAVTFRHQDRACTIVPVEPEWRRWRLAEEADPFDVALIGVRVCRGLKIEGQLPRESEIRFEGVGLSGHLKNNTWPPVLWISHWDWRDAMGYGSGGATGNSMEEAIFSLIKSVFDSDACEDDEPDEL